MKKEHKQVKVEWNGMTADVDEGIAPLILALWRAGINTFNSCQENSPGVAWVEFVSAQDACEFLNLVAVYPSEDELRIVNDRTYVGDVPFWETLYWRATSPGESGAWTYDVHPMNYGVEEDVINDEVVSTKVGPSDFDFSVSIRFPTTDMALILERLEASESGSE